MIQVPKEPVRLVPCSSFRIQVRFKLLYGRVQMVTLVGGLHPAWRECLVLTLWRENTSSIVYRVACRSGNGFLCKLCGSNRRGNSEYTVAAGIVEVYWDIPT